jgi:hypothetical protein
MVEPESLPKSEGKARKADRPAKGLTPGGNMIASQLSFFAENKPGRGWR